MTADLPRDIEVGVHGLRTFRIREDGYLLPVVFDTRDTAAVPESWGRGYCVATCVVSGSSRYSGTHEPPVAACGCGIYSWNTLARLEQNYRRHTERIVGVVALEGQTIEGTLGFRSQAARIVSLWLNPDRVEPALLEAVHTKYPHIPFHADRTEMITRYLPVEAARPLAPPPSPATLLKEYLPAEPAQTPSPPPPPPTPQPAPPRPMNVAPARPIPSEPIPGSLLPIAFVDQLDSVCRPGFRIRTGRWALRWLASTVLAGVLLGVLPDALATAVGSVLTGLYTSALAVFALGAVIDLVVNERTVLWRTQRWLLPVAVTFGLGGTLMIGVGSPLPVWTLCVAGAVLLVLDGWLTHVEAHPAPPLPPPRADLIMPPPRRLWPSRVQPGTKRRVRDPKPRWMTDSWLIGHHPEDMS